ncbi:hypothetical protein [Thioalkalivibrio sp. ALE19]|uniref:hypothetical protein n=1 Tax=Thioalkalivibrio sp. ALE19 TaxID=1266909 RepID=UPI0003FE5A36|nr:hypothetical protein [Thioalkalivibrio sp. ALE19]
MEQHGIPRTIPDAFRQVFTFWPHHPVQWVTFVFLIGVGAWAVLVEQFIAAGMHIAILFWILWVSMAVNPYSASDPTVPVFEHFRSPGYWVMLFGGVLAIIGLQTVIFGWPGWEAFMPTSGPLAPDG